MREFRREHLEQKFLPISLFFVFSLLGFDLGCNLKVMKPTVEKVAKGYPHEKHVAIFERENIECADCHTMHGTKFPVKNMCHHCHNNPENKINAPKTCYTCHINLEEVKPVYHTASWVRDHPTRAKIDSEACDQCHRKNFCTECHTKRDDVKKRFHDSNWVFYHSVKVRANPYQCTACHTSQYCIDCHSTRGVSKF
jgi:hypothetical protein